MLLSLEAAKNSEERGLQLSHNLSPERLRRSTSTFFFL
jgi:hypothetical protein